MRGAVDLRDLYDRTPLHIAAEHGHNQARPGGAGPRSFQSVGMGLRGICAFL